jgi:hypothetical protein
MTLYLIRGGELGIYIKQAIFKYNKKRNKSKYVETKKVVAWR